MTVTVVGRQAARLWLCVVNGGHWRGWNRLPARSVCVASNSGSETTHKVSD